MKRALAPMWPLALGLLACLLPWMTGAGNTLTLNLWDLAEWCSINPQSRHANIPLGASLGLRSLPLLLLALAIWRDDMHARLRMALALLTTLAVLPPPDLLLADAANPNYRQQLPLESPHCSVDWSARPGFPTASASPGVGRFLGSSCVVCPVGPCPARGLGLGSSSGAGFYLYLIAVLLFEVLGLKNIRATDTSRPGDSWWELS